MRIHAISKLLFDWLDRPVRDQIFHFELVRALYSTPIAIGIAAVFALVIITISGTLSGDFTYGIFFAGFLIVGMWRTGSNILYHRMRHEPRDNDSVRRWEFGALVGAWAFAGLLGFVSAYTLIAHPGTSVEILTNCCVIGYIAGISSRNSTRPIITIGQISLTCVPFTIALLSRADVVHVALAVFISAICTSTIVSCRTVFDNVVARHDAFKEIETLAQRDSLTDLWNRATFLELLEENLASAARNNGSLALIAIDLDRFKDINDTLGHPAGDAVLREVADRIKSTILPGDEVSRIGGDEFLVALSGENSTDVDAMSRRLLAQFSIPFTIDMTNSICGASIGYAIAPKDGASLDALLRNADLALYEAKKRGRGQIVPYATALSQIYENKVALEHDLQFALANDELEIVYQPIVDPRSGRAICCEALLRWNHPERGTISPDQFIPIAETTGLIVPIGTWVLNKACEEATRWAGDINVSINLSPVQFRRGREIVDIVVSALEKTGLPSSRLELEVTETVLIEDSATTFAILQELRENEIGVSLDDFGTGFASLAYLNDFPFSKVKIDRKFSQNIDQSPRTAAIIKGIAQTTRDLRIELVAEGIETEMQLERMRNFGINAIQGYLFSRPIGVVQLRRLIAEPILPALTQQSRTGNALPRRAAS